MLWRNPAADQLVAIGNTDRFFSSIIPVLLPQVLSMAKKTWPSIKQSAAISQTHEWLKRITMQVAYGIYFPRPRSASICSNEDSCNIQIFAMKKESSALPPHQRPPEHNSKAKSTLEELEFTTNRNGIFGKQFGLRGKTRIVLLYSLSVLPPPPPPQCPYKDRHSKVEWTITPCLGFRLGICFYIILHSFRGCYLQSHQHPNCFKKHWITSFWKPCHYELHWKQLFAVVPVALFDRVYCITLFVLYAYIVVRQNALCFIAFSYASHEGICEQTALFYPYWLSAYIYTSPSAPYTATCQGVPSVIIRCLLKVTHL